MSKRVRPMTAFVAVLILLTMSVAGAAPAPLQHEPVDPEPGCSYFDVTGHNVCDTFEEFWETHGGLPVFGYPLTEAFDEENPDADETYLSQYFERQRFELHPENAGTVYPVLLGRIGAQILELNGRNWHDFPTADPGAEHYIVQTGHAIAPEFWDYWSSHGLDFGDPGISFREAVLLFGYPISEPEMETNPDGDTVLTQWFERARFEYHPQNDSEHQVLLGRLGAELLEFVEPEPEPEFDVLAEGLDNPRHMTVGPDGGVYVAEAGRGGETCITIGEGDEAFDICYGNTGGITRVDDNGQIRVVNGLPSTAEPDGSFASGANAVAFGDNQTFHVVMGESGIPEDAINDDEFLNYFAKLISIDARGAIDLIANPFAFELINNPDGGVDPFTGEPELYSNPFDAAVEGDVTALVDAGGNTLYQVTAEGVLSVIATFPEQMIEAPEFLGLPPGTLIPMQAVPTSVAMGPDGAWYVGELNGFPFPVGTSRIWRIAEGEEPEIYAEGLTAIVDIAFDTDGNLLALEIAKHGLLVAEMAEPGDDEARRGALIRIGSDGSLTEIASAGLVTPTGLAVADDGAIYIANRGIFAGEGQIVRLLR